MDASGAPMNAPARTLRIAVVCPSFGGYGGLEAFVLALVKGLDGAGDLDVRLHFKRTAGFKLSASLRDAVAELGARVSFVPRASVALADAIVRADVVHAQNPSPDVVLLAKAAGRPLLINVINHRRSRAGLRTWLWRRALLVADRRFYISDFVRRSWEGDAAWPNSQVVFPISDLPNGLVAPAQRRGFVFAARWIPNKGIETLVDAYAAAALDPAAWPLTLIGDGPLRGDIERRIAHHGIHGARMPGFVSAEAKANLIRSARWMVVPPNTSEDFGLTAIEARHVGVPCIITRDGGVPEAAGAEALICEPGDVAGLSSCLRQAAKMSEGDYEQRARRTRESLFSELARPDFYGDAYRRMAAG
jgi:glycosyltransferase involved in cell wall biosynthesis